MARSFSGQLVRTRRLAAGYKPEQLALRIGRSVWSVLQYERGAVLPPAPVLGTLADQLSCTVDDFFTRESGAADAA